jgi:hypothetical protein
MLKKKKKIVYIFATYYSFLINSSKFINLGDIELFETLHERTTQLFSLPLGSILEHPNHS